MYKVTDLAKQGKSNLNLWSGGACKKQFESWKRPWEPQEAEVPDTTEGWGEKQPKTGDQLEVHGTLKPLLLSPVLSKPLQPKDRRSSLSRATEGRKCPGLGNADIEGRCERFTENKEAQLLSTHIHKIQNRQKCLPTCSLHSDDNNTYGRRKKKKIFKGCWGRCGSGVVVSNKWSWEAKIWRSYGSKPHMYLRKSVPDRGKASWKGHQVG